MIYLDDSGSSVVFLPLLLLLIAWEMNWTGPEVGSPTRRIRHRCLGQLVWL